MIEQTSTTELEQFDQGWLTALEQAPAADLVGGLVGLTRLGERPAALERLATVLARPLEETTALVRANTTARIEDGLVHWDEPFPGDRARRMLYVGDRAVPMKRGCAPDLPMFAAVLDVPFRVEDTCAATGVVIRVEFQPDGVAGVDPTGVVAALLAPELIREYAPASLELIDVNVCAYQPFFASADAAAGWLAAHPGGRVLTPAEMFQTSIFTYYRDHLRPLIHPETR